MPKLRISSGSLQVALWQLEPHLRAAPTFRARVAKTIMERKFSRFKRIRKICSCNRSTLVSLKRGFGEYYQCGYWAALENRGSRLLAAARGSNPLLSAAIRDPRDTNTCLTGDTERFLTNRSPDGTLNLVLKRGTVPFLGGLIGRLSF